MFSLNLMDNVAVLLKPVFRLLGIVENTWGDMLSTVNLEEFNANGLSDKSFKLPLCRIKVCFPFFKNVEWFMVKTLSLILLVIGIMDPLLFLVQSTYYLL